jgi:hypothetical protein
MKKYIYSLLFLLCFTTLANAQDFIEKPFYIAITGGIDNDLNGFRSTVDSKGFKYYGIEKQYNIGGSFGFSVTKRFRPRLELKYVSMGYGQYWDDQYSDFIKTENDINYFAINIFFDYKVLSFKGIDLYLSPGIKTEYLTSYDLTTYKTDGNTSSSNFNLFTKYFPNTIAGGAISAILKYNITDYIGITATPEYTYFFRKFAVGNDKNYQRLSCNLGVEFHF